jgi:hypothetical protein
VARRVRVELAVELDLDLPLEAVAMAREVKQRASPTQWEAMLLVSSALLEQVEPGLAQHLLRQQLHLISQDRD